MSPITLTLAQLAVLAYALVGGVFLAFSDFIMRALSVTGGHGGVEAMQAINREVFRWVFMTLFLGLAAASLALDVLEHGPDHRLRACGGIVALRADIAFTIPDRLSAAGSMWRGERPVGRSRAATLDDVLAVRNGPSTVSRDTLPPALASLR